MWYYKTCNIALPPRPEVRGIPRGFDDYNKARALYKHRGIVTYYVWQASQRQDVSDLLCLLRTMIMKY